MTARTDTSACCSCSGTSNGCASLELVRGRRCCESCTGDHDAVARRQAGRRSWPTRSNHIHHHEPEAGP